MTFLKTASVSTIDVATNDGSGFKRTASDGVSDSAFLSGQKSIDIKAALSSIASEYDISDNLSDYIFEAIRGNTANVPNDNWDGFHKTELLRFDHKLAKQVYRTYEYKPHHINHRAENPKNARGFIVDAHYNDSKPPLEVCPTKDCGNKTAERGNRDPETGIHCTKCGAVVKDEFVELLVAIDTKKDPTFADGVRRGILKHGSMGCSCLRTRCNVCQKVAYSRSEFCKHINSKGKEFDDSEPDFNPIAYVTKFVKGALKKIAVAFEWCEGVIYDEYSRVHDPADPKAEQYEVLQLTAKVAQLEQEDQLRNESEILLLQTKMAELERVIQDKLGIEKTAQVPPPPLPPAPPAVGGAPPPGAPPPPLPPEGMEEVLPTEPPGEEAPVVVNINVGEEGTEVETNQPAEEIPFPGTPIEELTPEGIGATPAGEGEALSPADVGLLPEKGKRGGSKDSGGFPMLKFADSYQNMKAEITAVGNVRVFDDEGTIFVVKPDRIPNSKIASQTDESLATAVLTMIAQQGLGSAISQTNAIIGPRLGQVLDYYVDDMEDEDRGSTDSVLDEADDDATEERGLDKKTETATGTGSESDRQEEPDTKDVKDDVLVERETDVEDEQHDRSSGDLSTTEMQDDDTKKKREKWNMGQSSIDDVSTDHSEKVAEKDYAQEIKKQSARLETIYRKQFDKKVAKIEKDKEEFQNTFIDRFMRAMKIVARRQALNIEYSPLKTAMGVALCNPRKLDDGDKYDPMDQRMAVNLVEASFSEPIVDMTDIPAWESQIDNLLERAASVMRMNDEALMQIDADLKNMNPASVPLDDTAAVPSYADVGLRQAANSGNLQLTTSNNENSPHKPGGKRTAIREAMGTTRVASLASIGK
jgi:hypothetical protein